MGLSECTDTILTWTELFLTRCYTHTHPHVHIHTHTCIRTPTRIHTSSYITISNNINSSTTELVLTFSTRECSQRGPWSSFHCPRCQRTLSPWPWHTCHHHHYHDTLVIIIIIIIMTHLSSSSSWHTCHHHRYYDMTHLSLPWHTCHHHHNMPAIIIISMTPVIIISMTHLSSTSLLAWHICHYHHHHDTT